MKFIPFLPTTWRKRKEKQHSVPSTPPRVTSGSRPSHSGSYLSYRTVPLSPGALSTTTTHSSLSISSTHSSSSIAPRRPPRPPSLRLDLENEAPRAAPFDISKDISITLSHRAPALSPVTRLSNKSSSSQLDNVWDDFLSDTVRGDTPTTREYKLPKKLPRSIHSNQQSDTVDAILDPLTPSIRSRYQSTGSTPHLPYTPDANDRKARPILSSYVSYPSGLEVKKGDETDFSRALSLFPSPPLQVCKKEKKVPNPLVLQPTPTIAPLPASPTSVESDSYDTTPLATPVTPTYHNTPCISISSQRSPSTVDASWLPGNLAPFDSHQLYLAKRKVPVSPLEPQHTSLSNFNQGMGPPKLQKMHTKFLTVGAKPSRPANAFPLYNSAAHKPPTCRDFQWGYAV